MGAGPALAAMWRQLLTTVPRLAPRRRAWRTWATSRWSMPILLLLLAATVEVWMHNRKFAVARPEHNQDEPFYTSCQDPSELALGPRENAALVMLVRNSELKKALYTIQNIERSFNRWFHYPVVFLNDEPWSEEFVGAMNATVSGEVRFEVIPKADWGFPSWMDEAQAKDWIKQQGDRGVLYGGLETYHHMCRFFSGKFYTLNALKEFKYYWRLEPDVEFYCSITYDPFVEMAKNKKLYGFTMALWEERATCPGLFREMSKWKTAHSLRTTELWKASVSPSWLPWPLRPMLKYLGHRDHDGDAWTTCHYWSNFEIADLDFFRGRGYQDLYEFLDKSQGFYKERWGDAAVHSLALAMLLDPIKIHHFEDFGYRHDYFHQCPSNAPGGQLPASELFGNSDYDPEQEGGIGCRCKCDNGGKTRSYPGYCLNKLKEPNMRRRLSSFGWMRSWYF